MGLFTMIGTSGMRPCRRISVSALRTASVRSTANAGTSTEPPRSIVRRMMSANPSCGRFTG